MSGTQARSMTREHQRLLLLYTRHDGRRKRRMGWEGFARNVLRGLGDGEARLRYSLWIDLSVYGGVSGSNAESIPRE